jgi:hypothetical protein
MSIPEFPSMERCSGFECHLVRQKCKSSHIKPPPGPGEDPYRICIWSSSTYALLSIKDNSETNHLFVENSQQSCDYGPRIDEMRFTPSINTILFGRKHE